MRVLVVSIIVLFNFVVQTTILQYIAIFGIMPNTALILIVAYAVLRGDVEACIMGFFAGILHDIFYAEFIGFHALLFALAGFLCGKPFRDFFKENYLLPIVLTFIGMVAHETIFFIIIFAFMEQRDLLYYLVTIILPASLYTAVLAIPIYRIMYSINLRLENRERKKAIIFEKKDL